MGRGDKGVVGVGTGWLRPSAMGVVTKNKGILLVSGVCSIQ